MTGGPPEYHHGGKILRSGSTTVVCGMRMIIPRCNMRLNGTECCKKRTLVLDTWLRSFS